MTYDSFVGTWRLVSFEMVDATGNTRYPLGQDPVGFIMYHPNGFMSVAMMRGDRPTFASEDIGRGSSEEKSLAFDTFFSYCGRCEVQGKKIIHYLDICSFPNWVGTTQERLFEFIDDKLILQTPPILHEGTKQTSRLIWERIRR
jgi:hypothetical protein